MRGNCREVVSANSVSGHSQYQITLIRGILKNSLPMIEVFSWQHLRDPYYSGSSGIPQAGVRHLFRAYQSTAAKLIMF